MTTPPSSDPKAGIGEHARVHLLAAQPGVRFWYTLRLIFANAVFVTIYVSLTLAFVLTTWQAAAADPNGDWRAAMIKISSGILVFIAAPFLVVASRKQGWKLYAWVAGVAVLFLLFNLILPGLMRAYGASVGTSLLLFLLLDLLFRRVEEAVVKMRLQGLDERKPPPVPTPAPIEPTRIEPVIKPTPVESAVTTGAAEAPLDLDKIKRFDEIMKAMQSGQAGPVAPDAQPIVDYLNKLKRENPQEYARLVAWAAADKDKKPEPKPDVPPAPTPAAPHANASPKVG